MVDNWGIFYLATSVQSIRPMDWQIPRYLVADLNLKLYRTHIYIQLIYVYIYIYIYIYIYYIYIYIYIQCFFLNVFSILSIALTLQIAHGVSFN